MLRETKAKIISWCTVAVLCITVSTLLMQRDKQQLEAVQITPFIQVSQVDSIHLVQHGFEPIGFGIYYGFAINYDINGSVIDSFPVFVLHDRAYDSNRDLHINIMDVTQTVGYMFKGQR